MTTRTMPGAVTLKEPPNYDGTMDYETIEVWLFVVENYFALVGLTDEIKQSQLASTLLTKNTALWQCSSHLDLNNTKFPTPKHELRIL